MFDAELYASLSNQAILVALSSIRIAVAFLLLPIFSRDAVPPLVRNALFVSMAVVSIIVQPATPPELAIGDWVGLFAKEVFIGLAVGVFFGMYLWAFETAGVVIDTQIGMSFALFFDPIIGNEATLFGTLLGRWAAYLFLAAGGMMLMMGSLIESFAIWPLLEPIDGWQQASVRLFEAELSRFMSLAVRIAGPIMAVLFLIDVAMGIINRSAQQFNVFFLSMSIKSVSGIMVLIILLPFLADLLIDQLQTQAGQIDNYLNRFLG